MQAGKYLNKTGLLLERQKVGRMGAVNELVSQDDDVYNYAGWDLHKGYLAGRVVTNWG